MKLSCEMIRNRWFRFALGILTLMLCACLLSAPGSAKADPDLKNWMKDVPDWIQISQINVPGTHDTGAYYMRGTILQATATTQKWTFQEQLEHGLRNFDIRLGKYGTDKYEMNLVHGDVITANCYKEKDPGIFSERLLLKDIMKTADDFVAQHPSETVILMIRDEAGGDYCNERIMQILNELYHDGGPGNKNYPHCVGYKLNETVPMLWEVRGKVVILGKKVQNASGEWENRRVYTDYATSYKWHASNKVDPDNDYTTPEAKTKEVKKVLQIANKYWPQLYAGVSHDTFQDNGTRVYNLSTDSKTIKPIDTPVMVSTNLTGINESDLAFFGPEYCNSRLMRKAPKLLSFLSYGDFDSVSLYTQNRRTGWWQFDFPAQHHINELINSNYVKLDEYKIVIDMTDYFKFKDYLDDFFVSYEVESGGLKTRITSPKMFGVYDKPNRYYTYLGTFANTVSIDPNTADFDFQLPDNCRIELTGIAENEMRNGGTEHVYTYEVFDINRPVEADITVEWYNKLDYDNRPESLDALYRLIGLDANTVMTFKAVDSKGNTREIKVPGDANITDFKRIAETDCCHMWVRDLPGNDGVGGRLTYTELLLPELPETGNYTMTVEKHPKYQTYTIKLKYKKPEGISDVDLVFNWMDGEDEYGLRKAANDYLINSDGKGYDIYNSHTAYSTTDKPLQYAKLLDAKPLDSMKGLRLTLQERDVNGNTVKRHEFRSPNMNLETPTAPNLYYHAVYGKTTYKANITGEPTNELVFYNNLYLMGTCDITVTWIGDDPSDRPNKYGLYVSLPGSEKTGGGTTVTVPPSSGNVWTGRAENRQIYDDNNQRIDYMVQHPSVYSYEDGVDLDDYEMSFIVTEDLKTFGKAPNCKLDIVMKKSSYVDVRGVVEWHDGNLTLTHEHPEIAVVQQYMKDPAKGMTEDNIMETTIPAAYLPEIIWNGDNYSFSDISCFPAYRDDGSPYTYRISIKDTDEYSATVNGCNAVLTRNIVVSGTADWEDPTHRPAATQPTVQLVRDGKLTGACVTESGFTYAFDPTPIADENNVPYEYSIAVNVEGFEEADNFEIAVAQPVQDAKTGNITVDAVLRLISEDRKAEIPVLLTLENSDPLTETESFIFLLEGENSEGPVQNTLTLNSENGFEGSFVMDASRFANGKTYAFTVTQMPGTSPYWDYDDAVRPVKIQTVYLNGKPSAIVDMGGDTAVRFTNTRLENIQSVSVAFDWRDARFCRPDTVKLHLLADGTEVRTVDVETGAGPEYIFENLPVFRETLPRTQIKYTLTADDPERYTAEVTGDAENGFTVTYTQLITVSGSVDWEDGKRPMNNQPTVHLYRNGADIGMSVEETGFAYGFTGLPAVDEDLVLYEYSIGAELEGVAVTFTYDPVERDEGTGYITANAVMKLMKEPVEAELPVVLKLEGIDPDAVTESFIFVMKNTDDGEPVNATVTLNSANQFTDQFMLDAAQFEANTPRSFTVSQIPGNNAFWDYDPRIAEVKVSVAYINGKPIALIQTDSKQLTFTNVYHEPIDTRNVDVLVKWDTKNNDGLKVPDSVYVILKADGTEIQRVPVSSSNYWAFQFTDLPIYTAVEDDKPIEIFYSVTAEEVEGFDQPEITGDVEKGFTITYTVPDATRNVDVQVEWDKENLNGRKIPDSVEVTLYADGKEIQRVKVTSAGRWAYQFRSLPSFTTGKSPRLIEYTVSATKVDNFDAPEITGNDANGFEIFYGVPSETTNIPVQITWVDENKKPVPKPSSVKVELFANNTSVGSLKLTSGNGWSGLFKNMPLKYRPSARRPLLLAALNRPKPLWIMYTLTPEEFNGFTVKVTGNAQEGFKVTYTAKKVIPPTGDSTPILPLMGLLLLSLGGILAMNIRRRKTH